MVKRPSAVSMVKGQAATTSEAPQPAQAASARPLPPGWYPDPGGRTGMLYWDGREWHTAPPPPPHRPAPAPRPAPPIFVGPPARAARRSTMWLWGLGIATGLIVAGSIVFAWSPDERSSSSTATPGTGGSPVTSAPTLSGTPFSPTSAAPPSSVGVIVGTCDEGGTCGVKQRTAPYTDAPRLYPNDLRDGMTVALACQTTGDVRSSAGHGVSSVWYRLDNGAYVNAVYINTAASGIPLC
jgi:serine/threonine protein kinase, bacterial